MTGDNIIEKSHPKIRIARFAYIIIILFIVAVAVSWHYGVFSDFQKSARKNEIMVIAPYRYQGTWVFDDSSAGLVKEPFIAGVPEMIDILVKDIPNANKGFRLLFSAKAFPGYQKKLRWLREDFGGNYYAFDDPPMEGWVCPAMFKYYLKAPDNLYVKAESVK